ncbi:ABC transporter permease [Bergeyella zoohelcum]|uniref:ABC-type transport system involved in multi-copper enzyme maturation, permease component n=1 Tax=Bergeyella zoohelcum TaxID=1015 RepID=A0A7Z9CF39_9FLAO|nr:ABC transporter permease [Bergeyella zoohelcum]MDY6026428.1 ABC transporter permease [Bergeyella zoohelcum]VDH02902.1 ABC-type transport system involved in multi-copper enzyme maturation, permease component [Bergeyella zoohelcum]
MRNIFLVARREFLTQVKKKSFIILTILSPILVLALGGFVSGLIIANSSETVIQVVDKSGLYKDKLKSNNTIKYIDIPLNDEKVHRNALKESEHVDGLLIIENIENQDFSSHQKKSELLINDNLNFTTKYKIIDDLTSVLREEKAKSMHLTTEQVKELDKDFDLKTTNINASTDTNTDLDFGVKYGLGMFLMYVTFMFILMYGVRVMRSVLEEKNNRVVEIIISSVKPFHLMLGKIIGVTLVALTQFCVWITMAVIGALVLNTGFSSLQNTIPEGNANMDNMNIQEMATNISHILLEMNVPLVIFVFLFFFLFGYIFYSSMYAAIGSAVDNETETQQFSLFAVIPLMLGMYGSFSFINNPDGPIGFWLSIIPFTSPVAMVARIPFGVPVWELILSMVLLIASSLFMVFIASKIYRIGILMYGNKTTMKELWKWIKES